MDTTYPGISFDDNGCCHLCSAYLEKKDVIGYRPGESDRELEKLVAEIKQANKDKPYDVVLGLSGGVDSAYMAWLATQLGLRILAVHVDTGWNMPVAEENIRRVCDRLNLALNTITIDWPTMRELQRAYLLSGVANLDVPQDHVFMAAVMKFARSAGITYVLNGNNLATEGASAPYSGQHTYMDFWHMRSIYKKHGRGMSLKKYPHLSFWEARWKFPGIVKVDLLNHVPYSKQMAMEVLEREFGWQYYGGKHLESRLTRYLQSVYQPRKCGYDKRRYHLSCLVMNGEMTREEALRELSCPAYPVEEQQADEAYILEKLEIDPAEWKRILEAPPTPNENYFSQEKLIRFARRLLGKKTVQAIQRQKSV
jgi:N-acetyl sugar amidotransferase